MDLSQKNIVNILAITLLLAALTQPIYTALYLGAPEIDRKPLWGFEGVLFTLMAAFGGAALVMAKRYTLGFAAIAFSTLLNVIHVGVGLTQFGPAGASAAELGAFAGSVYAFSFFGYNAAKLLLGLAALDFGMGKMKSGGKVLGGLTALAGVIAILLNTYAVMFGRSVELLARGAGFSGVVATLLLALCLYSLKSDD